VTPGAVSVTACISSIVNQSYPAFNLHISVSDGGPCSDEADVYHFERVA